MRRKPWLAIIIVVVVGSAIGIAGGTFLAWMQSMPGGFWKNATQAPFLDKTYVRILMIGEDDTSKHSSSGNGLSDTLVVFALNTKSKDIRALSIPRDTKVDIPGHGICKINAAHVYGGPQLTRQVVQRLLGVHIDYYIKTNTSGLRAMVERLGGVYIVVGENMRYTDRRGGLFINLRASPGKQLLNGKQAEGYVRFRHDRYGDCAFKIVEGKQVPVGRVVRQQYFMQQLANRVLAMPSKSERAEFLRECYDRKYIVSDLILKDWEGLAEFLTGIKPERIAMKVLPGIPKTIGGASYVVADTEKLAEAVERTLLFKGPASEGIAKVEVLNGCGVGGAAEKVADKLKQAGFQVTRTDNAPSFDYDQCCIIAHKGSGEPVQRIARLLDCADIRHQSSSDGKVDVTVIVGRDYHD